MRAKVQAAHRTLSLQRAERPREPSERGTYALSLSASKRRVTHLVRSNRFLAKRDKLSTACFPNREAGRIHLSAQKQLERTYVALLHVQHAHHPGLKTRVPVTAR